VDEKDKNTYSRAHARTLTRTNAGVSARKMWKVHVKRIEGFLDTAGFMDKADPYVKLIVGANSKNQKEFKTQVRHNAGGTAIFDEAFTFEQVSAYASIPNCHTNDPFNFGRGHSNH
jgi:hypothetical protein